MSIELQGRRAVAVVTNAIEDVHTQVDRTIASVATLIVKTLEAREKIGVSGTVAQPELTNMYAGFSALMGLRQHYIDNHSQLAQLGTSLGLPVTADGGLPKHPSVTVEDSAIAA